VIVKVGQGFQHFFPSGLLLRLKGFGQGHRISRCAGMIVKGLFGHQVNEAHQVSILTNGVLLRYHRPGRDGFQGFQHFSEGAVGPVHLVDKD
jgi:hypothetical protein